MEKMDKKNRQDNSADDEIRIALEQLRKLALTFPAKALKLVTATGSIEKDCIMVEVMNISSIGPRLVLAEDADPGDGQFDIIVVTADQRQKLVAYIDGLLNKKNVIFHIKPIRASRLTMEWHGKELHIDDECKVYTGQQLKISLLDSLIEVIVDGN
ncbi:hypothetical protein [Sphingobacterium puteale]|uniref:hypothetical protein n=1 Tax=Sphingobacterium puteale TaxID=2420510 RepID=UPI003D964255